MKIYFFNKNSIIGNSNSLKIITIKNNNKDNRKTLPNKDKIHLKIEQFNKLLTKK